jgi:2-dehydropantoate 2-reductase
MNILVFGAGVLGSLYAERLRRAGHRVALLARGARLADLKVFGLAFENAISGQRTFAPVDAVDRLGPEEEYDLALVPVRRDQIAGVLPALAANRRIPSVLFMVCTVSGSGEMVEALGRERVLMGCAGVGGVREGPMVRHVRVSPFAQKTVIGEIDGRATSRLKEIRRAFRQAGFPTELSSRIDAWLKTHVAWIVPAARALDRHGGEIRELGARPETVRLMVRAVREGFAALGALGVPVTGPFWVRAHSWMPERVLVTRWRRILRTEMARTGLAGHANSARAEMDRIAEDFRALAARSGISTPAMDELFFPSVPSNPLTSRTP